MGFHVSVENYDYMARERFLSEFSILEIWILIFLIAHFLIDRLKIDIIGSMNFNIFINIFTFEKPGK